MSLPVELKLAFQDSLCSMETAIQAMGRSLEAKSIEILSGKSSNF
jgi:hypothetical protein